MKELFIYLHDEFEGDPLRETLTFNHSKVLAFIKEKDKLE